MLIHPVNTGVCFSAVCAILATMGTLVCHADRLPSSPEASVRSRFALGVCAYWEHLLGAAEKVKEDKWKFITRACDDMKAHGVNTVFLGNAPVDADLDRFLKLCAERRMGCIPQTSAMYYPFWPKPEERKREYEQRLIPAMQQVLPTYRNRPGLLAWALVEETPAEVQAEIAEQRRLALSLDPTHTVVKCYNNLAAVRAMQPPYVPVVMYDTYRYTFSAPGNKGAGIMLTPRWAAESTQDVLAQMYDACKEKGANLWFVAQSTAEYRVDKPWEQLPDKLKEQRENLGAAYWDEQPSWHGWAYYRPPRNAIFLQAWQGISEGATGVLYFAYNSQCSPEEFAPARKPGGTAFVNLDLSETSAWREFREMTQELRRYSKLIPLLRKQPDSVGAADNTDVVCRTFRCDNIAGDFLVVVNRRIGTWAGQVYATDNPKVLRVNDRGELEGIQPADPLSFNLSTPPSDASLFDLETLKPVQRNAEGKASVVLKPGRGSIYYLGHADVFHRWVKPHVARAR